MTTQIKRRRGTTTEHNSFTGAEGEITIDTTKDTAVVHDGSTAGGHPLAKEDGSTLTNVDINSGSIDGVTIGGASAGAGTFTTLTATGNVDINGGTIKLDGNYPVGTDNVALGNAALSSGSLSGGNNVAIGDDALSDNTTGADNVAVGQIALDLNTTGIENVAVGQAALRNNVSGSSNVAVGRAALNVNTASNNTAVGHLALLANTTGTQNVAVGTNALDANTSASENTAIGYNSMTAVTTGAANTAIGNNSLATNTAANRVTAIGNEAFQTLNSSGNVQCTAVGFRAGKQVTTGFNNTLIGAGAGEEITTGNYNTLIGHYNGNAGGLDIRTSSNNIVLSDGQGNVRGIFDSSGHFLVGKTAANYAATGCQLLETGLAEFSAVNSSSLTLRRDSSDGAIANFFRDSNNVGSISVTTSSTAYNTSSDYRLKENVIDITDGIDRLKQLPVHKFNFISDPDKTVDGFLAHEAQAVVPEAVTGTKDELDEDGNPKYQGIDQSKLVPLLTAALKEAITRIETLEAEVTALKGN